MLFYIFQTNSDNKYPNQTLLSITMDNKKETNVNLEK